MARGIDQAGKIQPPHREDVDLAMLGIHSSRMLPPIPRLGETEDQATQYISLPVKDIVTLVNDYVAAMERQETDKWCRCEWFIHPDDTEVPDNACRECGVPQGDSVHGIPGTPQVVDFRCWVCKRSPDEHEGARHDFAPIEQHAFKGKRKRRGDQAIDCPVHTKEGFLIYFFEWVFTGERN